MPIQPWPVKRRAAWIVAVGACGPVASLRADALNSGKVDPDPWPRGPRLPPLSLVPLFRDFQLPGGVQMLSYIGSEMCVAWASVRTCRVQRSGKKSSAGSITGVARPGWPGIANKDLRPFFSGCGVRAPRRGGGPVWESYSEAEGGFHNRRSGGYLQSFSADDHPLFR